MINILEEIVYTIIALLLESLPIIVGIVVAAWILGLMA